MSDDIQSPETGTVTLDSAAIIADALREKFGERAEEVARVQLDRASPESVPVWIDIIARLAIDP
jgi:hypothetical protein